MEISVYFVFLLIAISILLFLGGSQPEEQIPGIPLIMMVLLGSLIAYLIGSVPIEIYGDKYNYSNFFLHGNEDSLLSNKDLGWALYNRFMKIFTSNVNLFFIITAFIYVLGYFVFSLKVFDHNFAGIFLIVAMLAMGFWSNGTNVIRSGFALSFLLMALAFRKNMLLMLLFGAFSVLSHKSMVLPISAFIITNYLPNIKVYLGFWFFCLLLSIVNLSFISNFLIGILGSGETNTYSSYLANKAYNKNYNTGFRIDFILYSIIPIIVAMFYVFKYKVKDVFYIRMVNTYILCNAIWLLVIRMAYTDRVAYLSWMLIPILLLFPLLKYKMPLNQRVWLMIIIAGVFGFNSFMILK